MKRLTLISLSLLPALLSATSITEIVQDAITNHPQIQVKKNSLNVQKERLTQVKSGYLPSIDLSYAVGPEMTRTPANLRERANLVRQEASAKLTQSLFTGLGTVYAAEEQKALILSSDSAVKESANSLALEAATAYLNTLKTHELYTIATENVEVHDKYLKQIKEKVDAGIVRSSDYEQTLSRYESAKNSELVAKQNYLISTYQLQRIVPSVDLESLEDVVVGEMPAEDVNSLVAMAMEDNPTLAVSKNDIKAANAAIGRTKSNYYPTADIVLEGYWNKNVHGLGYNTITNDNDIESEDTGYSGMLVINYNIFNGLADSSNTEANKYILMQQQSTLADAKLFVEANTKSSWITYEMTKEQLVYIDNNIKASAKTVSDYQQEHELGRRSIIDLLNIELEYNNAKNRKAITKYDNLIAYYQILSNTGKILEAMNVSNE
jgi:outer membrane protein, adhesin transport system